MGARALRYASTPALSGQSQKSRVLCLTVYSQILIGCQGKVHRGSQCDENANRFFEGDHDPTHYKASAYRADPSETRISWRQVARRRLVNEIINTLWPQCSLALLRDGKRTYRFQFHIREPSIQPQLRGSMLILLKVL